MIQKGIYKQIHYELFNVNVFIIWTGSDNFLFRLSKRYCIWKCRTYGIFQVLENLRFPNERLLNQFYIFRISNFLYVMECTNVFYIFSKWPSGFVFCLLPLIYFLTWAFQIKRTIFSNIRLFSCVGNQPWHFEVFWK